MSASWVTGLWAEFIAEIANSSTSPRGMNCDWLMGDMLIGDTSPVEREIVHFGLITMMVNTHYIYIQGI